MAPTARLGRAAVALVLVGGAVAGATAMPGAARAWCQMTTESGAPTPGSPCVESGTPLAWERRCMSYAVDGRGTPSMEQSAVEGVVARSFQSWTDVRCDGMPTDIEVTDLGPSTCREAEYRNKKGNVNTIAFIEDWDERDYDPRAFALTTVWHNTETGKILDADVQLNEQLGPFVDCPSDGCPRIEGRGAVDLRNVTTHEIGHFFGLAHSERSIATMAGTSRRGEMDKRVLDTDDVEGFCAIYPPGSLPAECDPAPDNDLDANCEDDGGKCSATAPGAGSSGSGLAVAALALLGVLAARRRG